MKRPFVARAADGQRLPTVSDGIAIATEYDRIIIPEARLAYQELLESYKANRVDWPTVLDAQMDYFDSRLTRVQHLEQVRTNEVLVRGYLPSTNHSVATKEVSTTTIELLKLV